MKKWWILFLFTFFFILDAKASSWKFEWDETTTTIEVPLGGNLQNYIFIPKAKLYRDGKYLEDADICYITTGDWLYLLTDVDTTKVGSYQVWYKAVENKYQPGQCQGYKTLITFQVVDLEKPIIKEFPKKIKYQMGAERPDYLKQVIAVDNSGSCSLFFDDSLVDYEKAGIYYVLLQTSDGYNWTEEKIELEVEDPQGPIISFLGENNRIILEKGEKVELQSYFKAIDKVDGDVTSSISYLSFSTTEPKSFDLVVSFKDRSGNSSEICIQVEIVDKDEPKLELYKSVLILEYTEDYIKKLEENIKEAYLGKENIIKDIVIDCSKVKNEVGSYLVSYSYIKNEKYIKKDCDVKMLSLHAPILFVENIQINVGQRVNIIDYIRAEDASDKDIQSKIEYDDSLVEYSREGIYPVRVSATNSSNLSTTETLYLTIVSDKSKEIEGNNLYFYLFLLLLIAVIGLGGIGIFLYKKRRNCNNYKNTL